MKAARYYGNSDVRIEDVPEPPVLPGEVGIDVAWCGICATDLREFVDGPSLIPGPNLPNSATAGKLPTVIGHEVSGVVYQVGEGVTEFEVGDHVIVEPVLLPPTALVGPDDDYNIHPQITWNGMGGGNGGLAEKMVVGKRWAHKIDPTIPLDFAALMEPLSTAIHAVRLSGVQPGQTALVTGAGPLGLLTTNVLTAIGVTTIVSEPSALRGQMAKDRAKADFVLDPGTNDIVAEVRQITEGKGADVGFECSANPTAVNQQLDALKPHGVLTVLSFWNGLPPFDLTKMVMKEITVRGSLIYNNDHPTTVEMVEAGKFNLNEFITHRIDIDELVSVGYDMLINRSEEAIKILVSPTGRAAGFDG